MSVRGVLTSTSPSSSLVAVYDAEPVSATLRTPSVVGLVTSENVPSARVLAEPRLVTLVVVLPVAVVVVVVTVTGRVAPATGTSRPSASRVSVPDTVTGSPYQTSRSEASAVRVGEQVPTVVSSVVGLVAAYTLVAAVL